ncbi:MAG: phenylalanine--tRNA ligase beta subunit-related protein [Bacillota bacterium]|nr:phenylalanine--tRNA ligase beta subunit-related protein [Bacillota bacterium]
MEFFVQQSVLDADVKIVFAKITGIDNRENEEWFGFRKKKIEELYQKYKDLNVKEDRILEGYNLLHDHTGVKRRKNVPASENLIKLLIKRADVAFINTAVDIYNLISIESKLALGAHDIDKTDGNVTLRFTNGDENFIPLGKEGAQPINEHEYSYIDDANDVLCRLEIRQVLKTLVTEDSKNVWYIVQGNEFTSQEYLIETAKRIIDLTTKYCGGIGEVILPKVIE